jgi:hypothetical protein
MAEALGLVSAKKVLELALRGDSPKKAVVTAISLPAVPSKPSIERVILPQS